MRKSTVMPREMKCIVCGYTQKDYTSYYKHRKTWAKNHDIDKCWEIRKSLQSKKAFDKMFSESLNALDNLTIIK
jgi:hypothetical protein